MTRLAPFFILLFAALPTAWSADDSSNKRIAVLEFQDSSGFDAPRGCGCIPMGPLEKLFGRTRGARERWNLSIGFRDMLLTALDGAYGYEPISPEELEAALADLKLKRKDLDKEDARRRLAQRLGADALLIGKIETFKQDRLRGSTSGQMTSSGGIASSGNVGVDAAHYRATARLLFTAYGQDGGELLSTRVGDTLTYTKGGAHTGPFSTALDSQGASLMVASQTAAGKKRIPPVVEYGILNRVKFGVKGWDAPEKRGAPPNYRRTLLGLVTARTLDSAVAHLRERIGPALPEEPEETPARERLIGKIALTREAEIYINLGGRHNVKAGDLFRVVREGEAVLDPDTCENIGAVETDVGVIRVEETMRPSLSRAVLVSGEAAKGDLVKLVIEEETEEDTKEDTEENAENGDTSCGD